MNDYVTWLNGVAGELTSDEVVAGVALELFGSSTLSYTELAQSSGVARSMVWDVLHNKKRPSVIVWAKIIKVITDNIIGKMEMEI